MTWDFMEPVTYLAGLVLIMAGYWYFLYVSRDLSYKAALRTTVSRRRDALYRARGFDLDVWERLVREANLLRGDVRIVADEYAVEWNETRELGSDEVRETLEEEEDPERKLERQKEDKKKKEQEKAEKAGKKANDD